MDFFTPIVDDPFTFGQIAATNSLSDIYAMGGAPERPGHRLLPREGRPEVLERILAGGLSKMMEAGCAVIGGHSVRDPEIKFGYSVTGRMHPEKVWANAGAQAGDRLVFTKAIGTGVISTAIKKGEARPEWIEAVEITPVPIALVKTRRGTCAPRGPDLLRTDTVCHRLAERAPRIAHAVAADHRTSRTPIILEKPVHL